MFVQFILSWRTRATPKIILQEYMQILFYIDMAHRWRHQVKKNQIVKVP